MVRTLPCHGGSPGSNPGHRILMGYDKFQIKTEDNTTLHGIIFSPHGNSRGTIVFSPGFYSKIEDYLEFIAEFSNTYTTIMYNLRGSGSRKEENVPRSGGTLSIANGASDIGQICRELCSSSVILMGHSLGGGLSLVAEKYVKPEAIVLLNPFIGASYLPDAMQAGIKLALALDRELHVKKYVRNFAEKFDNLLPNMNLKNFIRTGAALQDMSITGGEMNPRIQYFLSDNDAVLGTQFNEKQFVAYNAILSQLSSHTVNGNESASGLNHWFNHFGRKYFCNDPHVRESLAHKILDFLK
jgi:pimeloyl-ACP methyl ester carboxylesterase